LYEFLWESSLPPEFPIIVEDGEMEFDVTATQPQFEAFGSALEEMGKQYELLSLVHTDDRNQLLTDRQRNYVLVTHNHGYFDVPRDATLAEVAATLGVDPSSASETIRRATDHVVSDFRMRHPR
jgi:predicted DNA binding protein